jgi:hypothetical protein
VPGIKGQDQSITYRNYIREFVKVVKPDLISYDYYNFARNKNGQAEDGIFYFIQLALVRQCAIEAGLPFMNIIQASNFEKNWRLPNAQELRWQVYTTLAYGGKGFSYFLYWGPKAYGGLYQDGRPTALIKAVSLLNQEVLALSPVLAPLKSLAVFQTLPLPAAALPVSAESPVQIVKPGEFVLGLFSDRQEESVKAASYFMLVNRNYKVPVEAKIIVAGKNVIYEFDRQSKKWRAIKAEPDHSFSLNIDPGDGRLFRL